MLNDVGRCMLMSTGSSATGVGDIATLSGILSGPSTRGVASTTTGSLFSGADRGAASSGGLSSLEADESSSTAIAKENLVDAASMLGGRPCPLSMIADNPVIKKALLLCAVSYRMGGAVIYDRRGAAK